MISPLWRMKVRLFVVENSDRETTLDEHSINQWGYR